MHAAAIHPVTGYKGGQILHQYRGLQPVCQLKAEQHQFALKCKHWAGLQVQHSKTLV